MLKIEWFKEVPTPENTQGKWVVGPNDYLTTYSLEELAVELGEELTADDLKRVELALGALEPWQRLSVEFVS